MLLLDANLLIYAFRREFPQHLKTRAWLDSKIELGESFILHPLAANAFLRLTTKVMGVLLPSPIEKAIDFLAALQPTLPGPLADDAIQMEIFRRLAARHSVTGDGCSDLWLAASAIRHGLTLASADQGFSRFQPELRWLNPIAS